MASKNSDTKLRRELQALRNQAKAYGIVQDIKKSSDIILEDIVQEEKYSYVAKDLKRSLLFSIFAITAILSISIYVSNFPLDVSIRNSLHIHQLTF